MFQRLQNQLFLSTAQNFIRKYTQFAIRKLDAQNRNSDAQKFERNAISEAQFANFPVWAVCSRL